MDAEAIAGITKLLEGLAAWADDNGNKISVETNAHW